MACIPERATAAGLPAEMRLLIALDFFANGQSISSLKAQYKISSSTVSRTIHEVGITSNAVLPQIA